MKKMLLFAMGVGLVGAGSPASAAIVYSGSQDVTVALAGGAAPPAQSAVISLAGSPLSWDDFRIDLTYVGGAIGFGESMVTAHTNLTIASSVGTSMGLVDTTRALVLGTSSPPVAQNFAAGENIGPGAPIISAGEERPLLSLGYYGSTADGQFGAAGGYIGLVLSSAGGTEDRYGWLHLAGMSDIGYSDQSVTFDGWAYETVAGQGILTGDTGIVTPVPTIPAPGAFLLTGLGVALLARWRPRPRT